MILTHTILLWVCYPYHVGKTKQGSAQGSAQLYVDDDEGSAQFFGT